MADSRIAVITGATSGIGRAVAELLARRGARVVATGRAPYQLAALESSGGELVTVAGDVRRDDLMRDIFATAQRTWDAVPDLVVLSAGRGLAGTLLTSDDGQWDELLEVNYLSALRQLRTAARMLVGDAATSPEPKARDIVVIGSTVGRQVSGANPVYGSTKFALHAVVEALRQEICGHGVRVTLIEPGFVTSNFQQRAGYDPEWFRSIEAESGPLLAPSDVARAVEFVVAQPAHVHLDDIRIRPTRQRV
jgi:NADP-dependent 3-hydroxy acid dehydrogenase YdfG